MENYKNHQNLLMEQDNSTTSESKCFYALSKYLKKVYSPAQSAMWLYTLHGINDANSMAKQQCGQVDFSKLD